MSEDNNDNNSDDQKPQDQNDESSSKVNKDELAKIVEARVAEELKGIKAKLDSAYESRDEAIKKAVSFEEEKKQNEMKRLEDEGKHTEVAQMKIAELTAKLDEKESQITNLTRDNVVRDSLKGLDFKNDTAADFAYRDVVAQLIQDENGKWVHRTGASVKDFIESFRKDEDKEFLFKPKTSTGIGQDKVNNAGEFNTSKPITEMSTDELMAAAAAGQFDSTGNWV